MAKTLDSASIDELAEALDNKLESARPGMYQREISLGDGRVLRFDLIKRADGR